MLFSPLPALLLAAALLVSCNPHAATRSAFHIGIATGTVTQQEDDLRGAEQLMKEYGSAAKGGMIRHITFPDDFMSQQETVVSSLVALADDPLMKVVVASQAIPGVAEAFQRIRARRPDILLLAGLPHEDPLVIQQAAHLVVDTDNLARGYTIPWAALQMGARTLVHISFPRHMSYELLSRRRAIMEAACRDLGMRFVFESAPDPTSDVGVAGAQQFILEKVPQWLRKYGPHGEKVALFCTNDAQTEPLIRQVLASRNGVFVEADFPSPLTGFPGALGIDLSAERGDFPAIMAKIEQKLKARGGSGRFGTWAFSTGFSVAAGLGELGKRVQEGKARVDDPKELLACLGKYSPGAQWKSSAYVDSSTGIRARNQVMVYMDTYVFGQGYLGATGLDIPRKYYNLRKSAR
ncbi:MAG: DUF3798 domain-containing protein [Holophaga sp.]|nr:DUF3798 domain-containing protein [Holophaga sp.]